MDQLPPILNVSKVYLLQRQLEDMIAETKKDEEEINDPELKKSLQTSRGMIETLLGKLNKIKEQEEKVHAMRTMPPGVGR
jgi:hypothetical protein